MKNREFRRLMAIALMTAMVAGGTQNSIMYVHAADQTNVVTTGNGTSETGKAQKNETVYVKLDANGNKKLIEVSDQLKNIADLTEIEDSSDLQNIVNVKGEETFAQNGNALTWNGNGADICYQGTTDKELPVGIGITYELDGKKVTAEELEGKSGHLKIRYEYQNKTDGKNYTPFLMVTGLVLDTDKFTNVTVENGKLISDGERDIVIGMGIPKMKEALDVEKLDIPDYFEMEADVEEYEAVEGITVASNDVFNEMSTDKFDSLDELKDSMAELQDAADQLVSGSGELKDGLDTLLDSSGTLIDGIGELADGSIRLSRGTQTLASGAAQLQEGAGSLAVGTKALSEGSDTLAAGAGTVSDGAQGALLGMNQLYGGIETLQLGIGTLQTEALAGIGQVQAGADALANGIDTAASGAEQLRAGIHTAADSAQQLSAAASQLSGLLPAQVTGHMEKQAAVDNREQIAALQKIKEACADETVSAQIDAVIASLENQVVNVSEDVPVTLNLDGQRALATALAQGTSELAAQLGDQGQIGAGAAAISEALQGDLKNGAASLSGGIGQMEQQLGAGMNQLDAGVGALMNGTDGNGGAAALKKGMTDLAGGAKQVSDGSKSLSDNLKTAENGANALVVGSGSLVSGAEEVRDGSGTLSSGLTILKQGSAALVEGVTKLDEGAGELHDGMIQFNEEGIEKLVSAFDGDIKGLLNKVNDMLDASREYKSFSGISEEMDGEVKFIFVMDK